MRATHAAIRAEATPAPPDRRDAATDWVNDRIDSARDGLNDIGQIAEATWDTWNGDIRGAMERNLDRYVSGWNPDRVNPGHYAGTPVYYVNGVRTTHEEAITDAEALSHRLQRPILLIHNPTAGAAGDFDQALEDRLWRPPFPQRNGTTRAIAGLFLDAARNNQPLSIVSQVV